MKISMWSGPRNLSTAMMYSFGNRDDFEAADEPFYAPYLAATGLEHPMHKEILAAHESDPSKVASICEKQSTKHKYMKHMPHHMLEHFPLEWAEDCVNIHLLRHPARVLASYAAKRDQVSLTDIGYVQQIELFEKLGGLIIDSSDIRADPQISLKKLCSEIGLGFDQKMLKWEAGPRHYDGIWARHWYGTVHRSTGFAGAEGPLPETPLHLQSILDQAMPIYRILSDRAVSLLAS